LIRTRRGLGTHPLKWYSRGSPISDRYAPPDEVRGVLRNPPFIREFLGKFDFGQGHPL
jgi:hypothetical protein